MGADCDCNPDVLTNTRSILDPFSTHSRPILDFRPSATDPTTSTSTPRTNFDVILDISLLFYSSTPPQITTSATITSECWTQPNPPPGGGNRVKARGENVPDLYLVPSHPHSVPILDVCNPMLAIRCCGQFTSPDRGARTMTAAPSRGNPPNDINRMTSL